MESIHHGLDTERIHGQSTSVLRDTFKHSLTYILLTEFTYLLIYLLAFFSGRSTVLPSTAVFYHGSYLGAKSLLPHSASHEPCASRGISTDLGRRRPNDMNDGMNDVAMRIPRDSGSAKSCRGLINLNYC